MIPKVSVCITTYNHEPFIAQAIDSVLMQKTDFDFEILIGEDDSSDNTRAIVKSYAERYPDKTRLFLNDRENVIYINDRPTGRWNFINNLNNARGKYIALLDGDDYWIDPEKLQKQVNYLDSDKSCAGVFHETQVVFDDGRLGKIYGRDVPEKIYSIDTISIYSIFHTSSFLFKKSALSIPNWFFYVVSGDMALFSIISSDGYLQKMPNVMSVYRKHSSGITNEMDILKDIYIQRIMLIHYINLFHEFKFNKKALETIDLINYKIEQIMNKKNKYNSRRAINNILRLSARINAFIHVRK